MTRVISNQDTRMNKENERGCEHEDIKPVFQGRNAFIFEGDKDVLEKLAIDSRYVRSFKYDTRREHVS